MIRQWRTKKECNTCCGSHHFFGKAEAQKSSEFHPVLFRITWISPNKGMSSHTKRPCFRFIMNTTFLLFESDVIHLFFSSVSESSESDLILVLKFHHAVSLWFSIFPRIFFAENVHSFSSCDTFPLLSFPFSTGVPVYFVKESSLLISLTVALHGMYVESCFLGSFRNSFHFLLGLYPYSPLAVGLL